MRIALVGANGFVGSAVRESLTDRGHEVVPVRAPRVSPPSVPENPASELRVDDGMIDLFKAVEAVVNCAGNPDASEKDRGVLLAANALSPALVARASRLAGVARLVHVSSAVVQGRRSRLDETTVTEEFSAYAHSKAEGERLVHKEYPSAIIYRPPSVHAVSRRVTSMTTRIAASPLATVAAPGSQHSPQALVENVASAIEFLATTASPPPRVVIHPWEGLTALDLMELLGGKRPFVIPRGLARTVSGILELAGRAAPAIAPNARRIEMLWFGQDQDDSWLTAAGWSPPLGRSAWRELGTSIRVRSH
ncbi:NAD-dependent epimerase/dehydratase family protein [Dietzia cercidiphylli]|uniref:NAD-dependent epimerase/dehydratase family protein n=1 Tax=Dietzia cercidiphylli TaxID=498199 RepID=UPI0015F82F30|nr:NAD-dependent epimerase/dehydratase family protein [Dietzia cercidiphylli]